MKYVVVTVVLELSDEEAGKIDAGHVMRTTYDHISGTVVRTRVDKCHTQEEALTISRRGAP